MKKVSLILAALALVLGISQCKKQEEPVASGEKQHIVLNASFGGGNSKIADPGNGELIWSLKDIIKVLNSSNEEIGTLTCTDAANGIFEGEIEASEGQITFEYGSQLSSVAYFFQTGELKDAIYLKGEANYQPSGNYNVTMDMPHAVVKLDLSEFLVSDERNVLFKKGDGAVAGLVIGEDFEEPCYVAILSGNIDAVFGDKSGSSAVNWSLEPNYFYTAAGEGGAPTGKAIVIEPAVGGNVDFTMGDETSDYLNFNLTIEPNAGCVINEAYLYLSLSNPSPEIDKCDLSINCEFPFSIGSISKDEIKNLNYGSGQPIYIRLCAMFQDPGGFSTVYVYSDKVIETSFTFVEEEEE